MSAPKLIHPAAIAFALALFAVPCSSAATFQSVGSGEWNDGSTWNQAGAVPGPGDAVEIADTHTVTVTTAGGTAASVSFDTLLSGATLRIHPDATLTIIGDVSIDAGISGSATVDAGSGTLAAGGSIDISSGGGMAVLRIGSGSASCDQLTFSSTSSANTRVEFTDAGLLSLKGALGSGGTLVHYTTGAGSTVRFDGASQTVNGGAFHHLTLAGTGTKTIAGNLDLSGDFSMPDAIDVLGGTHTINVAGNWNDELRSFIPGRSSVIMDGPGRAEIRTSSHVAGASFYRLRIAKSNGGVGAYGRIKVGYFEVVSGGFGLSSEWYDQDVYAILEVYQFTLLAGTGFGLGESGTVRVSGPIFTAGTISGGVTVGAGTVDFPEVKGRFVITGSMQNQTWTGTSPTRLPCLIVDKPAGKLNLLLDLDIEVPDPSSFSIHPFLFLMNGMVLTGNHRIKVASSGAGRINGYLNGRLDLTHVAEREYYDTLFFPLGTARGYAPVTVQLQALPDSGPTRLEVGIKDGPHPDNTSGGSGVLQTYWTIDPLMGSAPLDLTFEWPAGAVDGTEADYVLARHDGYWTHPPTTINTAARTATATATGVMSLAGDWTVGAPASVVTSYTFGITTDGTAVAGLAETVTVTAKDSSGNTLPSYSGEHTLIFSGATGSPDDTAPAASDMNGIAQPFGTDTVLTFENGVATTSLLLYKQEEASLHVSEPAAAITGTPAGITVAAAPASMLAVDDVNSGQPLYANAPFTLGLSTTDAYGNPSEVAADTEVTVSTSGCGGCTGTLGGTRTRQISGGDGSVTFTDLTYDASESDVTIGASATAGDSLDSTSTEPLTFAPQVSALIVTNDANGGAGSLRDAIHIANSGACSTPCSITFDLPPAGPHTFQLTSALPVITVPAIIDGTTQEGFAGEPILTIDGALFDGSTGFEFTGGHSTLRGFELRNFSGAAIELASSHNTIDANAISHAAGAGIRVTGAVDGNVLTGNAIVASGTLPIDLDGDGDDPQDAGDADTGANGKQNYPLISTANVSGGELEVAFSLDSGATGAGSMQIELFEAGGTGAPLTSLGTACFAGNNLANRLMTVAAGGVAIGDPVVATATSFSDGGCGTPAGGTSEVSPATTTNCVAPPVTITAPSSARANRRNLTASVPTQSSATYVWGSSNATITAGQGTNAVTFSAGSSGIATLTVIVTVNGCSSSASRSVAITGRTDIDADLAISKSAAGTVQAGAPLTYTLLITNHGPSNASDVTVTDALPPGTTFSSAGDGPWSCNEFSGGVYCNGSLAAGANSAITLTVDAPQQAGTITNTATVDAGVNDPVSGNNSSSATTTVLAAPDDCSPEMQRPIVIAPLSNARVTSPVSFSWSTPPGASSYDLFVIRDNQTRRVATSITNHADGVSLPDGNLRWFVRAYFAGGCTLDSADEQLEVVPAPAACSPMAAPAIATVGRISTGVPFTIQWTTNPGATSYELQLASDSRFSDAEVISTGEARHQLTRVNAGLTPLSLYARVRAVDSRCQPAANVTPYGPASAIFILPVHDTDGAASVDGGVVTYHLPLGPELAGQSFTASSKESWITIAPPSGIVPAGGLTLVVTAGAGGLPLGTSRSAIRIALHTPAFGNEDANVTTLLRPVVGVSKTLPVHPLVQVVPPPNALIIPAVAHADGMSSKFQSDVRVTNTSSELLRYQVSFTPSGGDGPSRGRQTTFSIEPGQTVALDDVLRTWFGTSGDSVGTLQVLPLTQTATTEPGGALGVADRLTFASSRTFNVTADGTFGQYIPAIPFANFIGLGGDRISSLSLQQIAQSVRYRTNLGIVEGSGQPASLLVKVFGETGQKLTEFPVQLKGGEHTQLNAFLASNGVPSLNDGRVEISVIGGGGKVTAYASVLDNETNDPLLVTPVTITDAGDSKWVMPGVADIDNGAANWQTDMRVFNGGTEDVTATFSFYSQNGGAAKTADVTIPAGQVRQFDRTLSSVFGVTNDGGAVHISTPSAARLVATARTYNQTNGGTYGQFISAVTPAESASRETRALQVLQVEESARFRTNLGLAEVTGNPATVQLSIVTPDTKTTAFTELTLAPNEFRQLPAILRSFGLGDTFNARITVRVIDGPGRVTAYGSMIDMKTNDPTYVPAQ